MGASKKLEPEVLSQPDVVTNLTTHNAKIDSILEHHSAEAAKAFNSVRSTFKGLKRQLDVEEPTGGDEAMAKLKEAKKEIRALQRAEQDHLGQAQTDQLVGKIDAAAKQALTEIDARVRDYSGANGVDDDDDDDELD